MCVCRGAHIRGTFSNTGQEVTEDLLLVWAEKFNYALTKDVLTQKHVTF